jgi:hypothetical protein
VSYEFRWDERNSCLNSESPPVSGNATRFFKNEPRRSSFSWIESASVCFGATTAAMYFTKLIPHFSHFTPVRCLLPQDGHSKRIVMWQRWQKRATSRTAAPHFGQGSVACGTGAAVGSQVFAWPGGLGGVALERAVGGRASGVVVGGWSDAGRASGWTTFGWGFVGSAASEAAPGGLPSPFPEDELPVILHLSGNLGTICALP